MYLEWEKIVKLKKYEIFLLNLQNFRLYPAEWGSLWQVKPQKSKSMQNFGYFYKRNFLFGFALVQLWNISKMTLWNQLTLFHVHHNALELSIGHFQTPKDQGYLQLTQNFENFDIAKHQKCPFLNQKSPLCNVKNFHRGLK